MVSAVKADCDYLIGTEVIIETDCLPILGMISGCAHDSWVTFEKALLEAYVYERSKGQDRRDFDQLVALTKTHQGGTEAFIDFER